MDDASTYNNNVEIIQDIIDIKFQNDESNLASFLKVDQGTSETKKSKVSKITERKFKRSINKVSDELKQAVVDSIDNGICSRGNASETFDIPYSTVVKIYKRFLETGVTKQKKRTTFLPKKIQDEHINFLLDSLADDCTLTIKQLSEIVYKEYGIEVNTNTIAKILPCFHFTLKRIQNLTLAAEIPTIINEHQEYCEKFLKFNNSERTIIYFDQTEFQINMRVLRGSASHSPSVRKRKRIIIAGMTKDELLFYKAVDEHENGVILIDYLKDLFEILSKRSIIGSVLIMGNAAMSSNYIGIKAAIELAGHDILILPLYSPFFNPIENMFSEWANVIRSNKPNGIIELEQYIHSFNDLISGSDCLKFCRDIIEIAVSCTEGKFECKV